MDSITDILNDASKDVKSILKYKDNAYLRNLMDAAMLYEKRFNLPTGTPPYKPWSGNSVVSKGTFWQIARKISIFQRTDLSKAHQERLFIESLESLSNDEAKTLIAVKDQCLEDIYPNVTYENLKEVGYY